jgi:5-methylcytosine-specific restriction endonuclease McrA
MRRQINRIGSAECYVCGNTFFAPDLEVDHKIPLWKRREADSIPGNVAPICRADHADKCRQEALERAAIERKRRG